MTNIFVTEFNDFSETFMKNSNDCYLLAVSFVMILSNEHFYHEMLDKKKQTFDRIFTLLDFTLLSKRKSLREIMCEIQLICSTNKPQINDY